MAIVEERVQIALENWAPRFIANGVDANDVQTLSRTIARWEDWSTAWSRLAAIRAQVGEEAETEGNFESAGEHYFGATMLYHFGKFMMVGHPDRLRAGHDSTDHGGAGRQRACGPRNHEPLPR